MVQSEINENGVLNRQPLPKAIVVSSEPVVQCETWVRARLLEMLLGEAGGTFADLAPRLDQYGDLLKRVAKGRDESLADCLYAGVWAIGLALRESIHVELLFEKRVCALVDLSLADTPTAPSVGSSQSSRSTVRQRKSRNRTKSENLNKG